MVVAAERNNHGQGGDTFSAYAQAELGFRLQSGPWYFRLDLDIQLASNDEIKPLGGYWSAPPWSEAASGFKLGPPEWAMLQYSLDAWRFRAGFITNMLGYEDWDAWINAFPTRSLNYNVTPGRTLGLGAAYVLESGHELFVYGGCDLDWADCFSNNEDYAPMDGLALGAGVYAARDLYATWSGITAYPKLKFYVAGLNAEFYPHDALAIAVEAAPGLSALGNDEGVHHFFFMGGVTLNVLPSEMIHPTFRFHGTVDPDDNALNGFLLGYDGTPPDWVASAGLSVSPFDGFKIAVEGKAQQFGFGMVPGLYTGISFARPEPDVYSATYEEEEEAEAPATDAAR